MNHRQAAAGGDDQGVSRRRRQLEALFGIDPRTLALTRIAIALVVLVDLGMRAGELQICVRVSADEQLPLRGGRAVARWNPRGRAPRCAF